MIFDRTLWENVPLNSICEIKRGDIITKKEIRKGEIPVIASAKGVTYFHDSANVFDEVITVSSSGVNAGFVNFHTTPIYASDCITIQTSKERALLTYLFFYLKFSQNRIMSFQRGTAQPHVYPKDLIDFSIPLPPLEDQERIVELIQSIESCISTAEKQEKNLKLLRKTISDSLTLEKPKLGKLIAEENCHNYAFSELCDCIEEHEKSPLKIGISRFIGLENIETDNFKIQGYGNVEDGTTFTKKIQQGDVLFGKRRAYLRKVAVADFEGICSGDILVFRAKEQNMLRGLLPYYVASEKFFHYAINTSAGSLSPRTKWKDLAKQTFNLPDLQTQEKILDLINQLEKTLLLVEQQITNLNSLKQKLLNSIFA